MNFLKIYTSFNRSSLLFSDTTIRRENHFTLVSRNSWRRISIFTSITFFFGPLVYHSHVFGILLGWETIRAIFFYGLQTFFSFPLFFLRERDEIFFFKRFAVFLESRKDQGVYPTYVRTTFLSFSVKHTKRNFHELETAEEFLCFVNRMLRCWKLMISIKKIFYKRASKF